MKKIFKTKDPNKQDLADSIFLRFLSLGLNDLALQEIMDDVIEMIDMNPKPFDDFETFCQEVQKNTLTKNSIEWGLFGLQYFINILNMIFLFNIILSICGLQRFSNITILDDGFCLTIKLFTLEFLVILLFLLIKHLAYTEVFRKNKVGIRIIIGLSVLLPVIQALVPFRILKFDYSLLYFLIIGSIVLRIVYVIYRNIRYKKFKS